VSERPGIFDHEGESETSLPEESETPLPDVARVAGGVPLAHDVEEEPPAEPDASAEEIEQPEHVPVEQEPVEPEPIEQHQVEPDPSPVPAHAEGDLRLPLGIRTFSGSPNGARRSVGIAVSRFNGEITSKLLDGALAELDAAGVAAEAIELMPVPGAFELPLAAMALAKSRRYSCVLALGCVIRGETPHFDFVAAEAASGVQLAGLETGVPVSFGVLTCDTREQAEARAGGPHGNKGTEAARSALEMVESLGQLRSTLAS
jgi:6,7-dimethyl-8-ribityllumazine synthase